MRRILTISAPVALAVALLGACGVDTTQGTSKKPAVIKVGARGAESAPTANGAAGMVAADSKMAIWQPTTFVLADGLEAPIGPRRAWSFVPAGAVSEAQKAALEKAFGLSGSWTKAPADQGGYEYLGDPSKGESSITINSDAMQSWWYSQAWDSTMVTGCVEPAVVDPAVGDSATSAEANGSSGSESGSTSSTDAPDVTIAVEPRPAVDCTPKPPANVPTKAEAEAKAKALFEQLGLDPASYVLETYADDWGAYVTGWLVLDGMKTQLAVGVGFGAEGAITGASGFLAQPVQGDEYDLVSLAQAVDRMNNPGTGYWGGYYGGPMAMARGGMAVDAVAASDVAVSTDGSTEGSTAAEQTNSGSGTIVGEGVAPEPAPSDPGLTPEPMPAETMPTETMPPVEPIEVTLTGVTMGLAQLWDADGNIWMLPAYVFTDANGGQYPVYAIGDEYLDFSGAAGTTDTVAPGETTVVDGTETTAVATPATDAPGAAEGKEPESATQD